MSEAPEVDEKVVEEEKKGDNSADMNAAFLIELKEKLEQAKQQQDETKNMFTKMNMIIGELRGKIIEQEKYIAKLESRAAKADDLVKTLDPMTLSKRFEEESAKLEAVEAKMESFNTLATTVQNEVGNVKNQIYALGSSKDLQHMNKKLQDMLKEILRIESRLSVELEKSNSYFFEMQKNYSQSLKYFGMLDGVESSIKSIRSQQNKIELSIRKYVPQDQFNRTINEFNKFMGLLGEKYKMLLKESGLNETAVAGEETIINDAVKNISAADEVEKTVEKTEKPKSSSKDDMVFMRSY